MYIFQLSLLSGCLVEEPKESVFRATIGPEGGVLSGGGMTLTVPEGALSEETTLEMRVDRGAAPDGGPSLSPTYSFEPEGLVFADWVLASVEVDEGLGQLWWSMLGDPDTFEPVGIAAGGLAEGYVLHFSSAFVGEGVCELSEEDTGEDVPANSCSCRANDEVGDLLCPDDPSTGEPCDVDGYSGLDGGACSGYGPRAVLESWCDCYNDDRGYLCPDPYVFEPSQQCPSEGGLNGFHGEVDQACMGYDIDGSQYSGTILYCSVVTEDTVWQSVSGTLEGCTDPGTTSKKNTPPRCSTSQLSWEQECLDVLDDYGKDRTTACPDYGDASTVGSTFGAALEEQWRGSDPQNRLTQVEIPYANKDDCKAGVPLTSRGVGKPDLFEVVSRGAEVLVRVGDIKPLTRSGLDLGWREIHECYVPAIEEAGKACGKSPSQRTPEQDAFCKKLGANKVVKMDNSNGVLWDLGPLDPMEVYTCEDGLVAYTCP